MAPESALLFVESGSAPKDKDRAWRWLLLNLLVLPGWGSIRAGRRRSGYGQLMLGIIGGIVTVTAVTKIALEWARSLQLEEGPDLDQRLVWWTAGGVIIFTIGWFWALATSVQLLQQASSAKPPRLRS